MKKRKGEAKAICSLIDAAFRKGYPKTLEGRNIMRTAMDWLKDSREKER